MIQPFQEDVSPDLALAESLIPSFEKLDDDKRRYLGFRVAGFSKRESLQLSNTTPAMLITWIRRDRQFKELEKNVLALVRTGYHKTLTSRKFSRVMHLAMIKDEQLFRKSLEDAQNMTIAEWSYLRSVRSLYVPQQLSQLESMFKDVGASDWDELLIVARKNTRSLNG